MPASSNIATTWRVAVLIHSASVWRCRSLACTISVSVCRLEMCLRSQSRAGQQGRLGQLEKEQIPWASTVQSRACQSVQLSNKQITCQAEAPSAWQTRWSAKSRIQQISVQPPGFPLIRDNTGTVNDIVDDSHALQCRHLPRVDHVGRWHGLHKQDYTPHTGVRTVSIGARLSIVACAAGGEPAADDGSSSSQVSKMSNQ
jgi:hypothetical protein